MPIPKRGYIEVWTAAGLLSRHRLHSRALIACLENGPGTYGIFADEFAAEQPIVLEYEDHLMALAAASLRKRTLPDSQGRRNTNYSGGNDPAQDIELSILAIDAITTVANSGFTLDLRQFVNVPATGTVTLSISTVSGTTTGWALTVDSLGQTGASASAGVLRLLAVHSSDTPSVPVRASRDFSVTATAAASTDTIAPSHITRVSLTQALVSGSQRVTALINLPCDPKVTGENATGLATLIPTRNGVDRTPVAVSAGISPQLEYSNLGTIDAGSGSAIQSGNDYTLTCPTAGFFVGTGENGGCLTVPISGSDGFFSAYFPAITGTVPTTSSMAIRVSTTLVASPVNCLIYQLNNGNIAQRTRASAGGSSSSGSTFTGTVGSWLGVLITGGTVQCFFSRGSAKPTSATWVAAGTAFAMQANYLSIIGRVGSGGSATGSCAITNFGGNMLAPFEWVDTSPPTGATTYSFRCTDGQGNTAAASGTEAITVDAPPADTTGPTPQPTISATGGQGVVTIVVTNAASITDASPPVIFQYYRGTSVAGTLLIETTDTSYSDTGRADSTSYSYVVRAKDSSAAGNVGTVSAVASATTNAASGGGAVTVAPTNLALVSATTTSVTIGWTPPANATSHIVIWGLDENNLNNVIQNVPGNSYAITGVPSSTGPGTEVFVRVRGANATTPNGGPAVSGSFFTQAEVSTGLSSRIIYDLNWSSAVVGNWASSAAASAATERKPFSPGWTTVTEGVDMVVSEDCTGQGQVGSADNVGIRAFTAGGGGNSPWQMIDSINADPKKRRRCEIVPVGGNRPQIVTFGEEVWYAWRCFWKAPWPDFSLYNDQLDGYEILWQFHTAVITGRTTPYNPPVPLDCARNGAQIKILSAPDGQENNVNFTASQRTYNIFTAHPAGSPTGGGYNQANAFNSVWAGHAVDFLARVRWQSLSSQPSGFFQLAWKYSNDPTWDWRLKSLGGDIVVDDTGKNCYPLTNEDRVPYLKGCVYNAWFNSAFRPQESKLLNGVPGVAPALGIHSLRREGSFLNYRMGKGFTSTSQAVSEMTLPVRIIT